MNRSNCGDVGIAWQGASKIPGYAPDHIQQITLEVEYEWLYCVNGKISGI